MLRNASCFAYLRDKGRWTRNLGISLFTPIVTCLVIRKEKTSLNDLKYPWIFSYLELGAFVVKDYI